MRWFTLISGAALCLLGARGLVANEWWTFGVCMLGSVAFLIVTALLDGRGPR